MFNDEILERIFGNKEMQTIPIGTQATAVRVVEDTLEEIVKERSITYVSELFISPTESIL